MHHQVVRDAQGNAIIIAQDSAGYLSVLAADPNKKSTTFGKYINFINPVQPEQISVESDSKAGNWAVNGLAGVTGQVDGNATTMYVLQEFPKQYGSMVFNSAAQTYELYDASGANKTVFTLDSKSQVQYLSYIPVDTNGQIQTKSVSDLMQSACLIMSTDATPVTLEVIFNGIVYKPASAGSSTFTSAGGDSISVQAVSANPDCAAYAVITQGAKKYIYSYAYQILSSDDFADLQHNIWNMNTAMSSTMKAVLCENMHEKGLKQVTTSLVKGIPANRILAVQQAISGMQFDAISGKYFAPIKAADYGYFGQAGFVDIENGCLYDSAGLSYGYSITLQDYVALLDKLGVMVIYNSNTKKYDIVYRTAQAVSQQTASLPEASGNGGAVKSA